MVKYVALCLWLRRYVQDFPVIYYHSSVYWSFWTFCFSKRLKLLNWICNTLHCTKHWWWILFFVSQKISYLFSHGVVDSLTSWIVWRHICDPLWETWFISGPRNVFNYWNKIFFTLQQCHHLQGPVIVPFVKRRMMVKERKQVCWTLFTSFL